MNIDTQAERDLFAGTTQGEWTIERGKYNDAIMAKTALGTPYIVVDDADKPDAAWIVYTHNTYPALLAEIDKGREARRKLEEAVALISRMVDQEDKSYGILASANTLRDNMDAMRRIAGEGGQDER